MNQTVSAAKELKLQDLLAIEDHDAIAEFRCSITGIPLWPQIRLHFFRMLMTDLLYETTLTGVSISRSPRSRSIAFVSRALLRNAGMRLSGNCRAEICVMTDGVANQWRDGRWFNRLSDYFVSCRPQTTLAVEDHFEWQWPFPRYNDRVLFHTPQQAQNAIVGRLRLNAGHVDKARTLVRLVSQRAQQHCGWIASREREQQLIDLLARKTASLPWQYRSYLALLDRIQPKLLLASVACYGAAAAALMTAANRAGIATAEYQHGAVSGGHDAYNFATALCRNEAYLDTLPRSFLVYGSWWSEQINAPVSKVIIGNPHREETLANSTGASSSREDVLILSDGVEFSKYLDLAQQIESVVTRRGLRVVIRPHPLERTAIRSTHGAQVGRVVVDSNADLYTSLRTAHAVVSELSTGMFEGVGLADKFFMWDTAKARFGYPRHPFQSFSTPGMLLELLAQSGSGQLTTSCEAIWAASWRDRYLQFINASRAARLEAGRES